MVIASFNISWFVVPVLTDSRAREHTARAHKSFADRSPVDHDEPYKVGVWKHFEHEVISVLAWQLEERV